MAKKRKLVPVCVSYPTKHMPGLGTESRQIEVQRSYNYPGGVNLVLSSKGEERQTVELTKATAQQLVAYMIAQIDGVPNG